jgi:ATP-dependent exoDNAse (exonuclease V) alpha subunit
VIDEAGMIGSRQLERVLGESERHGAKVILVGDPEQLPENRADPKLRADRFVERWQGLDRQRAWLERAGEWQSERKIRDHMGAMAKSLERDPQVESISAP